MIGAARKEPKCNTAHAMLLAIKALKNTRKKFHVVGAFCYIVSVITFVLAFNTSQKTKIATPATVAA